MRDEGTRMHRVMLATAVATLMLVLSALEAWAGAQMPAVTVMPRSGNQFQSFTFVGTGFMPGVELHAWYTSPDMEEFPYAIDGEHGVITADARGSFTVTVVPAVDFAGARSGRWTATFCITESTACWKVEFSVSR